MIQHDSRGLDIPGGHIEKNEGPLEALAREVLEEADVTIKNLKNIGYMKIELLESKPEDYKYPYPVSYQMFFYGQTDVEENFRGNFETNQRIYLSLSDVLDTNWGSQYGFFVEEVFKINQEVCSNL